MKTSRVLVTALAASTILAGAAAYAADQPAASPPTTQQMQKAPQESAAQKAIDKDAVKLSADGATAYRDMHSARVAIFNADPNQAKTLIGNAQTALSKAKTDESVFTKAEADLKQPAGMTSADASTKASSAASANDAAKGSAAKADAMKPIAWLPVDGQLTLGEDFVATPQKAAAVTDANKSLEKGDQKGAVEKLKLAGINVNFTMAVLPLTQTTTDVDQAAQLLNQGKYYEANSVLKQAEDGMRFDMIDSTSVPQKAAVATTNGSDAHAATQTGTAKPVSH